MNGRGVCGLGFCCALMAAVSGCAGPQRGAGPAAEAGPDRTLLVSVESRVIHSPRKLAEIAGALDPSVRGQFVPGKNGTILLNGAGIGAFMRNIQSERESTSISAPRLTMFNRDHASISFTENVWRENGALRLGSATRPLVSNVKFDVTARAEQDRSRAQVDFTLTRGVAGAAGVVAATGNNLMMRDGETVLVPLDDALSGAELVRVKLIKPGES